MTSSKPNMETIQLIFTGKLTCTKCKNYLTVAPVYSLPTGESTCGRCFDQRQIEGYRNVLYENILEYITCPCMNKQFGCLENRTGNEMYNHEMRCSYRRINCTSCDWIGDLDSVLEHYEDEHPRYVLNTPTFEINFLHSYVEIYLLPCFDRLFFFKQHGDLPSRVYSCSLMTIFKSDNENFEYSLTLKNPSSEIKKEFEWKMAKSLNDQDGFTINIDDINEELQNPSTIVASIDVIEYSENRQRGKKKKTETVLSNSNKEMLRIIECPVCMEYMVPPIYQCLGGHSICSTCKTKVAQCPTCQSRFGDTQNYAVESFTDFLKYPCKNNVRGCDFHSEAKIIRKHEEFCVFGILPCPTREYSNCSWTGILKEIWKHCKGEHLECVVENPNISFPFVQECYNEEDADCFLMKSHNQIFLLHWKYDQNKKTFFWTVQLVGPVEESESYFFDLDIIDTSGKNLRIYMKCFCEAFSSRDEAFNPGKSFLYLLSDQVKPMIHDVFTFRVTILKNN